MNKILAFLLPIIFIILAWFGWGWYKQNIACCNEVTTEVEETTITPEDPAPEAVKFGPLVYNWDSDEPITNDLWPAQKKEILSADAEGKIFRIVGPYFKDEANNTSFENLGLARADAVRKILVDSIPLDRMEIDSKLTENIGDMKTKPFGGTVFDWAVRNENIKEVGNKTLIYFPYNSTKKLENANINNYLISVAESLKGNEKNVALSGHTDNKGNPAYNKNLALKRTKTIKAKLIKLGISADRISTTSFGEEKPIDTNDTEKGRQNNRRVELEIQ